MLRYDFAKTYPNKLVYIEEPPTTKTNRHRPTLHNAAFENEARLRSHIKEEVGDTQIWQETELLSEYLIIFAGRKVGIEAEICFGPYEFPQVLFAVGDLVIVFREHDFGAQIQQFAHLRHDGTIEFHEAIEALLIERAKLIGVIEEIRTLLIGTDQGIPMQMPPIAVLTDAHLARCGLCHASVLHRHGERQRPIWPFNDAAVAIGLLHVMVVVLHHHVGRGIELCEILNIWPVGRSEDDGIHENGM